MHKWSKNCSLDRGWIWIIKRKSVKNNACDFKTFWVFQSGKEDPNQAWMCKVKSMQILEKIRNTSPQTNDHSTTKITSRLNGSLDMSFTQSSHVILLTCNCLLIFSCLNRIFFIFVLPLEYLPELGCILSLIPKLVFKMNKAKLSYIHNKYALEK